MLQFKTRKLCGGSCEDTLPTPQFLKRCQDSPAFNAVVNGFGLHISCKFLQVRRQRRVVAGG